MNLYDYTGVIHLHSSYSYDGHTCISSIIKEAADNGIDFLMLTDHNHLKARDEGWEGWQGKTLLIVGQEVSPRFNHYLAFNIQTPITYEDDPQGLHPQKYLDKVNRQGGFGLIAHPDHEGAPLFHVKHYAWNDWNVSGYTGLSIWDFMTDWQKSLRGYFSGLLSFLFPAYFLKGPRKMTLERWDRLNAVRKTVGFGELDNHASIKKLLGLSFVAFPYAKAFQMIRTHVLTKEPFCGDNAKDTDLLFSSLLHGRCYFALEYFQEARGFQFRIEQDGQSFYMGDSLKLTGLARLIASFPAKARVRVIASGSEILNIQTDCLNVAIDEPGIYRVEAYLKSAGKFRPWIFSNPIFVT